MSEPTNGWFLRGPEEPTSILPDGRYVVGYSAYYQNDKEEHLVETIITLLVAPDDTLGAIENRVIAMLLTDKLDPVYHYSETWGNYREITR